jgi:hypothetical protein
MKGYYVPPRQAIRRKAVCKKIMKMKIPTSNMNESKEKIMKGVLRVSLAILAVLFLPLGAAAEFQFDRTVLPIHEPEYPSITKLDARNATPPPRIEVK